MRSRPAKGSRDRQNAPYQRMRTKDGDLMVGAAGQSIWARCAAALGHPEWCGDPRFATNQERMENRAALEAEMNAVLATQTTEHWVEVLEAARVPCGQVHTYAQLFDDPQVRHRGLVQYASDAELGEVPHIGTRSRFLGTDTIRGPITDPWMNRLAARNEPPPVLYI